MLGLRFEPQIFIMSFYVQLNDMYMHYKQCTIIAQDFIGFVPSCILINVNIVSVCYDGHVI